MENTDERRNDKVDPAIERELAAAKKRADEPSGAEGAEGQTAEAPTTGAQGEAGAPSSEARAAEGEEGLATHNIGVVARCTECKALNLLLGAEALQAATMGRNIKRVCGCGHELVTRPDPTMPRPMPMGEAPPVMQAMNRHQRRAEAAMKRTKGGIIVPR